MRWSAGMLRFAQGAIAFLYLMAAFVAAGLATVGGSDRLRSQIGTLLVAVGAATLVMPEILVGAVIGALTFAEADSRRGMGRLLAPYAAMAVIGSIALLASIPLGVPAWDAIPTFVVGLALLPAFVALGRAARRCDVVIRADDPAGRARIALRSGFRSAAVGAGVGLAIGLVLAMALVVLVAGSRGSIWGFLLLAPAFACFGAAVGGLAAQRRIGRIVREVVGPEFGQVRRVARVVIQGRREPLSEAEQRTASEYARVIEPFLCAQALLLGSVYTGLVLNQVVQVLDDRRQDPVPYVLMTVFVLLAVVLAVFFVRRIRRVRVYAATHPVFA